MNLMVVCGARPNFVKIAPLYKAVQRQGPNDLKMTIVHTGQHYDARMSEAFFQQFGLPEPDMNLEVGSGSHAEQIGHTMIRFEKVIQENPPDWVVLVGDVNATCACSIAAKKCLIPVAHIEAGLRSFDLTMPEEINRMVCDRLSDLLLTPDELSMENLRREGTPETAIHNVGNIMIDTLMTFKPQAEELSLGEILGANRLPDQNESELEDGAYGLITLHRPSNVDEEPVLRSLVRFLIDETRDLPAFVWPVHPRTRKNLEQFQLWEELVKTPHLILTQPLGYLEMLRLMMRAKIALTDSGGLQEESCVLGVPCLTLRPNTERPITLEEHGGPCILVGNDLPAIREAYQRKIKEPQTPFIPPNWDGHTAERILDVLRSR